MCLFPRFLFYCLFERSLWLQQFRIINWCAIRWDIIQYGAMRDSFITHVWWDCRVLSGIYLFCQCILHFFLKLKEKLFVLRHASEIFILWHVFNLNHILWVLRMDFVFCKKKRKSLWFNIGRLVRVWQSKKTNEVVIDLVLVIFRMHRFKVEKHVNI